MKPAPPRARHGRDRGETDLADREAGAGAVRPRARRGAPKPEKQAGPAGRTPATPTPRAPATRSRSRTSPRCPGPSRPLVNRPISPGTPDGQRSSSAPPAAPPPRGSPSCRPLFPRSRRDTRHAPTSSAETPAPAPGPTPPAPPRPPLVGAGAAAADGRQPRRRRGPARGRAARRRLLSFELSFQNDEAPGGETGYGPVHRPDLPDRRRGRRGHPRRTPPTTTASPSARPATWAPAWRPRPSSSKTPATAPARSCTPPRRTPTATRWRSPATPATRWSCSRCPSAPTRPSSRRRAIEVNASLSGDADLGEPLRIQTRAGFAFGADPAGQPLGGSVDPGESFRADASPRRCSRSRRCTSGPRPRPPRAATSSGPTSSPRPSPPGRRSRASRSWTTCPRASSSRATPPAARRGRRRQRPDRRRSRPRCPAATPGEQQLRRDLGRRRLRRRGAALRLHRARDRSAARAADRPGHRRRRAHRGPRHRRRRRQRDATASGRGRPSDARDGGATVRVGEASGGHGRLRGEEPRRAGERSRWSAAATPRPGRSLEYTIDFQVSDFFSFDDLRRSSTPSATASGSTWSFATDLRGERPRGRRQRRFAAGGDAFFTVDTSDIDNVRDGSGNTVLTFDVSGAMDAAGTAAGQDRILRGGESPTPAAAGRRRARSPSARSIQDEFSDDYATGDASVDQNDRLTSTVTASGTVLAEADLAPSRAPRPTAAPRA